MILRSKFKTGASWPHIPAFEKSYITLPPLNETIILLPVLRRIYSLTTLPGRTAKLAPSFGIHAQRAWGLTS
ncbi:hypothetical protein CC2G_000564 [Coprinopsis cinerea AmutBmut pab1-1]|nr:hypothetical protein CC2G_000564 [Coprinopsis cinerea AmutBmut pab1-1]